MHRRNGASGVHLLLHVFHFRLADAGILGAARQAVATLLGSLVIGFHLVFVGLGLTLGRVLIRIAGHFFAIVLGDVVIPFGLILGGIVAGLGPILHDILHVGGIQRGHDREPQGNEHRLT